MDDNANMAQTITGKGAAAHILFPFCNFASLVPNSEQDRRRHHWRPPLPARGFQPLLARDPWWVSVEAGEKVSFFFTAAVAEELNCNCIRQSSNQAWSHGRTRTAVPGGRSYSTSSPCARVHELVPLGFEVELVRFVLHARTQRKQIWSNTEKDSSCMDTLQCLCCSYMSEMSFAQSINFSSCITCPKHMIDSPRKREQGVEPSMHTASIGEKEANKGGDSMMTVKVMLSFGAASRETCN